MVKPVFENLDIDFWIHTGKVGVTQPTLCMFHASPLIGTQLLDALTELKSETCPAQRTLTFRTSSRKSPLEKLKLRLVLPREELKVMSIRCDPGAATIEMTEDGLGLLVDAFNSWFKGAEDFGVSPRRSSLKPKHLGELDRDSGELWFWGPHYDGP